MADLDREARSKTIAVIGDYGAERPTHKATQQALEHAVRPPLRFEWLATEAAAGMDDAELASYAGLLISPGSPYRSMDGALKVIRVAREQGVPLLGTCGGFQHVAVEFVRDVLGVAEADHEESNPGARELAIVQLPLSLAGGEHEVFFARGSRVAAIYGASAAVEPFFCSYGLNPEYRSKVEEKGLAISGTGADGAARAFELPEHPFFVATLYVPQARYRTDDPHPLVTAFVAAAEMRN
ncbi:MAG: gamma-glutamyl-gamma-aminobutyrate hydrolase family protein [Gaiellaceae bacterium]